MKSALLATVACLVVVTGCAPDPFIQPDRAHEVHLTPYSQGPGPAHPPPDLRGLPTGPPPAPPGGSGQASVPPNDQYIWIPGYYQHSGQSWNWVPGGWWLPQHGRSWISGRWVGGPGGTFYWQKGHWQ